MVFVLTNIAKNAHGILHIFGMVYLGEEEYKRVIVAHAWRRVTTTATKQLRYCLSYYIW